MKWNEINVKGVYLFCILFMDYVQGKKGTKQNFDYWFTEQISRGTLSSYLLFHFIKDVQSYSKLNYI